jgi:hypothetical protein
LSEHSKSNTTVHQLLELEAQVTVTPHIKNDRPKIFCLESEILPSCESEKKDGEKLELAAKKCCFTVSQVICVEIPISFDVDVDVDKGIVHCCKPDFGPCELRELPKPPEPQKSKEADKPPNLINLLNIFKLINPRKLKNLLNKDILSKCLYHIPILPNIMHHEIRKVCDTWQILVVVVETPVHSQLLQQV